MAVEPWVLEFRKALLVAMNLDEHLSHGLDLEEVLVIPSWSPGAQYSEYTADSASFEVMVTFRCRCRLNMEVSICQTLENDSLERFLMAL